MAVLKKGLQFEHSYTFQICDAFFLDSKMGFGQSTWRYLNFFEALDDGHIFEIQAFANCFQITSTLYLIFFIIKYILYKR